MAPTDAAADRGGCPYNGLPEKAFFRNDTLRRGDLAFQPDPALSFTPSTRVMSAGSCFAARIADFIRSSGIAYLSAEDRIAVWHAPAGLASCRPTAALRAPARVASVSVT